MKRTRVCAAALFVVMSLGVFAQGKAKVLKYGHHNAAASMAGFQAQYFADLVNQRLAGQIKVEVFPNSQLGSIQEHAEMIAAGTIEFSHNGFGQLATIVPELEVLDTPYLAKTVADQKKLLDLDNCPLMKELAEKLMKKGVHILATMANPLPRLLTCNKPVYKPSDLKGVKIRAIPAPMYVAAVKGLGGMPVPVDWADVPTALATGVVAGQENPINVLYESKMWETQKYVMKTNHIIGGGLILMNEKAWQSLTPEQQKVIRQAALDTAEEVFNRNVREEEQDAKMLKEKGMTFIDASNGLDINAFKANTDKVVLESYGKYESVYKQINEYLGYR